MKIATCLSIGLVLWSGIANAQPTAPARQINWTQLALANSPSARLSAMATINAGPVVLFGGLAANNTLLGDTWEWTGATGLRSSRPIVHHRETAMLWQPISMDKLFCTEAEEMAEHFWTIPGLGTASIGAHMAPVRRRGFALP
jgi:hypothetical protein